MLKSELQKKVLVLSSEVNGLLAERNYLRGVLKGMGVDQKIIDAGNEERKKLRR